MSTSVADEPTPQGPACAERPGTPPPRHVEVPAPPAAPADTTHRSLKGPGFWKRVPGYRQVDDATFADAAWQARNSITRLEQLATIVDGLVDPAFLDDAIAATALAPMSLRLSPYLIALIDWENARDDPIRRQFVPLASGLVADHPKLGIDSLNEVADSPVAGLTHRYPDKALFLALDACPVYCRFCTRSYSVGQDTASVTKIRLRAHDDRWEQAFAYLERHEAIEDVVVSGGDVYMLKPQQILAVGMRLLAIPHIRRIRFATKGLGVLPQKIVSDAAWRSALVAVAEAGRRQHKQVALHTHINHHDEITYLTRQATDLLLELGITVRNQAVLQRGVNDTHEVMARLTRRLGWVNIHPYYVYMHDLVRGVEDLRTPLQTAIDLEKSLRGCTAGFNTPTFVVDAPGGGGKRDVHSFEHYSRETGISVFRAPAIGRDACYLYFDPVRFLSPEIRRSWTIESQCKEMIAAALGAARAQRREAP